MPSTPVLRSGWKGWARRWVFGVWRVRRSGRRFPAWTRAWCRTVSSKRSWTGSGARGVTEHAVTLPAPASLVGVFTEAEESERSGPAVVFLHAPLRHRVGPDPAYVTMSRHLAR